MIWHVTQVDMWDHWPGVFISNSTPSAVILSRGVARSTRTPGSNVHTHITWIHAWYYIRTFQNEEEEHFFIRYEDYGREKQENMEIFAFLCASVVFRRFFSSCLSEKVIEVKSWRKNQFRKCLSVLSFDLFFIFLSKLLGLHFGSILI